MRVRRGGCVVLGAVVAISLLSYAGWRAMQPKVRLASEAEVRAKFDSRLLEPLPHDAKAQARYGRFADVLLRKDLDPWRMRKQLLQIVREGPLEGPATDPTDFPRIVRIDPVLKASLKEVATNKKTDPERAVSTIIETLELRHAFRSSARSIVGLMVATNSDRVLVDAIVSVLSSINKEQAERLWKAVAADPGHVEAYRTAILAEAQAKVSSIGYFFMKDPTERNRTIRNVAGTYDALATAELSSELHLAMLDGTGRPLDEADTSADARLEKLQATVPNKDEIEKLPEGAERSLKEFVYRVQVNNHSNSWGVHLAGPSVRFFLEALANLRNEQQMLTLCVALRLYELRHGKLPASVQPLVSDGLLKALPADAIDGKPFKYDPAVRVVSSATRSVSFN